jgi:hypothetical protein
MQPSEPRTLICDLVTHNIYESEHRIEKNTPSLYESQTKKSYPVTHLFSRFSIPNSEHIANRVQHECTYANPYLHTLVERSNLAYFI